MSYLKRKMLVFFDTETTGLNPEKNAIIEIAAIKISQSTLEKVGEFVSYLKPPSDAVIEEEALDVNKIASDSLASAPDAKEVLEKFLDFSANSLLVGQNIDFDLGFVREACRKYGLDFQSRFGKYTKLDTMVLAWHLLLEGKVTSLSLKSLCEYYGIDNTGSHRALTDVERTFKVYKKLLNLDNEPNPLRDPGA